MQNSEPVESIVGGEVPWEVLGGKLWSASFNLNP